MNPGKFRERWMRGSVLWIRRALARTAFLASTRDARFEAGLGGAVSGVVVLAAVITGSVLVSLLSRHFHAHRWVDATKDMLLLSGVLLLTFNALMHLVARQSFQKHRAGHVPIGAGVLEACFMREAPAITILIPCRDEDAAMLTRALMSAALQTFPRRRVVLLIDELAAGAAEARDPAALRTLTRKLQQSLMGPAGKFTTAFMDHRARRAQGPLHMPMELRLLAELNLDAAEWYRCYAQGHPGDEHVDGHFVEHVLERLCNEHLVRAQKWQGYLTDTQAAPDAEDVGREYQRLAALFSVEITSFERARYANLSRAPGTAMNLNSYIGLSGRNFHERLEGGQRYLEEGDYSGTWFHVPDADYFLLLDADTYIAPDYLSKLAYFMQQPGQEKMAIVQTPACPAPSTGVMLQRVAGALMQIRYALLQGYAHRQAATWTGESGLIRKSALQQIARTRQEWGLRVTRYFHGRHACAGAATTLALLCQAWRVTNYPERLAWVVAPSELGALAARYRRSDDSGLSALPGLLAYLWRSRWRHPLAGLLRMHNQAATVTTNLALLALLSLSVPRAFYSVWLGAAVSAYALLLMRDLKYAGYPWSDFLRVYALRLLLIPVSLGGAVTSWHRAWTHSAPSSPYLRHARAGFGVYPHYYLAVYGLLLYWFIAAGIGLTSGRWMHGLVVGINAAFMLYAVAGYIGFRESLEDVQVALHRRRRLGGRMERFVSPGYTPETESMNDRSVPRADGSFNRDAGGGVAFFVDPYVYHTVDQSQEMVRSRRVLVPQRKPPRHSSGR